MATILEELQKLEEARKRGDVDVAEVKKLRQNLTEAVEEAEFAPDTPAPDRPTADPVNLLRFSLNALGGLAICVSLVAWLITDSMLALTLGVTLLAAFIVRAAQQLEE